MPVQRCGVQPLCVLPGVAVLSGRGDVGSETAPDQHAARRVARCDDLLVSADGGTLWVAAGKKCVGGKWTTGG